jgi:ParB family chromosome partitioning protein
LQPRKRFAQEELNDLADSIREKGVLQPILARPVRGEANAYEIVAGERRWRAAQMAQLHEVPVVVRDMNDSESLEIAIIENVQRADLNAIEEAAAYYELMERFKFTQEKVAKEVGKSRSHIANTLRLLTLPESVRALVRDGQLSAGHARTLIGLPDAETRARDIIAGMLNVREAEQRSKSKRVAKPELYPKDAETRDLEARLSNALGLKVQVRDRKKKGGEVRIAYRTLEQLDEVARRLSRS